MMARDDLEILRRVIAIETRYLRHYVGTVIDDADTLNRGRVLCEVAALGWTGQSKAAWCWPRDKSGMTPARVGDAVEVYFLDGWRERPVYMGIAHEQADMAIDGYDDPEVPVLFDSRDGLRVMYDREDGKATIEVGELVIVVEGEVAIEAGGDVTVDIDGTADITASGTVTINGNLEVDP